MTRQHGTYVKYVQDLCRCDPCKDAHRAYNRARRAAVVPPYVSASEARAHIAELAAAGVGLKTVAKTAGVSHGALSKLVYGDRTSGRGPSKRIRRSTHDKIMAVTPAAARGGAKVPAAPTRALLDEMITAGIPKARIATELGAQSPALQVAERSMVTASTANAVAGLHHRWKTGQWTPVRLDRWGNAHQPTPPPPADRGRADVSDLYLELAEIVEERRAQAEWRQSAACRGRPTWMWFPGRGDTETLDAARAVCGACFVRDQCRAANLDRPDGVYGALSAKQRRDLRQDDPVQVREFGEHGTNAGYARHLRRGTAPCQECLVAHRHYVQDSNRSRSKASA